MASATNRPEDTIVAAPLKGIMELPAFGRPPGEARALQNMRANEYGFYEARGGLTEFTPTSGTASDPIEGFANGGHQHTHPAGFIMVFDSAGAANQQYLGNWYHHVPDRWKMFRTPQVGDIIYFGSDQTFSMLVFRMADYLNAGTFTLVWEYWNGSNFNTALTMASTPSFTSGGGVEQFARWAVPSNWARTAIGDLGSGHVTKYWMRIRLSAVAGVITNPTVARIFGNWTGFREFYIASVDPTTAGAAGSKLKRYDQNGTAGEYLVVSNSTERSALSRKRITSYRHQLFYVDGTQTTRFDGYANVNTSLHSPQGYDLKNAAPTAASTVTTSGTGITGTFVFYTAYGYGPNLRDTTVSNVPQPMYGWSPAVASTAITLANQGVNVDTTPSTPSDHVSVIGIYVTQDLTGVATAEHGTFPAYLVAYLERASETTWIGGGIQGLTSLTNVFPPIIALGIETLPPDRCKLITIYQNRCVLGANDVFPNRIWWSDAFFPSQFDQVFNFMDFTLPTGGRLMGFKPYADTLVVHTEDQTWGLSNLELEVPHLFVIHHTIGLIAPDAAASGDGVFIWPSKNGFYLWDGSERPPNHISKKVDQTFGFMDFETYGGSWATIANGIYTIHLLSPDGQTSGGVWEFNIMSGEWNTLLHNASVVYSPITTITMPTGHPSAGETKPIFARARSVGSDNAVYSGEITTQDIGANYTCYADIHFGPNGPFLFSPSRAQFYYQASDGWGTPAISVQNTNGIWVNLGSGNAESQTPDTGADYSVVRAPLNQRVSGTQDIVMRFSVLSAASGTVNRQRVLAGFLHGTKTEVPPK